MSIASQSSRIISAKSAIASAIVSKGVQVPSTTKLDGYASLIAQIQQGGSTPIYQSKTFTPTSAGSTILPDVGYNALSQVVVNGDADLVAGNIKSGVSIFGVVGTYQPTITLQNKTFTPTSAGSTISADAGYSGLSQVTVAGDANLVPSNIASGVSIFGVVGTHSGGGGSGVNYLKSYAEGTLTSLYDSETTKIAVSTFRYQALNLTYLEMTEVSQITSNSAFYSCTKLATVSMPKVTSIVQPSTTSTAASKAFYSCSSIASVYMPLLSSVPIGLFGGCSRLTSVDVTSAQTIGSYAFTSARFSSISLPYCKSIYTTAFGHNPSLKTISLPQCTYIGGGNVFINCSALSSISAPALTTLSGGSIFANCTALTTLSFPKLATLSGVGVFYSCTNLSSLYLMNSAVCTLPSRATFNSGPFSSTGTGTIYVPASLYNSYLASTNWKSFSARLASI